MIVKQLDDIIGSESDINTDTWRSYRLLLKKDGMGFSMHHTVIKAGSETYIWYKNHVEAVYCIQGDGEIEVVDNNDVYPITKGTLYALNGHEKHKLRAKSDMHMVCVFNPPVTGREIHQEDGSYPLVEG
ncbi:ectoine synthase [Syntrophomonas wolfei]|jgi:L-ectoine synthase|uniref:ectoine synthase n=1 Tax=Syntrophomonas wolfei TaxID=863 RepID=UPI0023F291BE|nr:ectoine synthase [Syntrophomonas wolfei]